MGRGAGSPPGAARRAPPATVDLVIEWQPCLGLATAALKARRPVGFRASASRAALTRSRTANGCGVARDFHASVRRLMRPSGRSVRPMGCTHPASMRRSVRTRRRRADVRWALWVRLPALTRDSAVRSGALRSRPAGPASEASSEDRRLVAPAARQGHRPVMSAAVDLYWIPLGAGAGRAIVQWSGRLCEALAAALARRPRCDLFHSALEIHVEGVTAAVEMAPVWMKRGDRGVVAEGPVGARFLGRSRLFRYEVRCWRGGSIRTWQLQWAGPSGSAAIPTQPGGSSTSSRSSQPAHGVVTSWARARCGTRTRSLRGYWLVPGSRRTTLARHPVVGPQAGMPALSSRLSRLKLRGLTEDASST